MNKLPAEAFGTFCLVVAGTGAIVVDQVSGGTVTHVGVALVSGAHLIPAVSIGFVLSGRLPARELPRYVLAQVVGAFAASALLRALFPASETLRGGWGTVGVSRCTDGGRGARGADLGGTEEDTAGPYLRLTTGRSSAPAAQINRLSSHDLRVGA